VSGSLRDRVVEIALALPEAEAEPSGPAKQHVTFRVRKKKFAYFVVNEHNDGRIALLVKAAPGQQQALVGADARRHFVPKYIGPHGWVGLDLEVNGDWDEVRRLLSESYRLIAPKKLAASL